MLNEELSAKRLELLVEMLPSVRRVAVLWDSTTLRRWVEATERASRELGVEIKVLEISELAGLGRAFDAATTERTEALDVLSSAFFDAHKDRVVELAARAPAPRGL